METSKGRVLNGIVKKADEKEVVLLIPNREVRIPRAEIVLMLESRTSIMPTELLYPFNEHELRSLIAYVTGRAQVPMLALPGPGQLSNIFLFSGRDLINWHTAGPSWKAVDGEIVAPGPGGRQSNRVLISDLILEGDFQLTVRFHPGKNGHGALLLRDAVRPERPIGPRVVFSAGKPLVLAGGELIPEGEKPAAVNEVKADSWNKLEVIVADNRLQVRLNDGDVATAADAKLPVRRVIALEGSGSAGLEIRFRNLDIRLPNDKK